MGCGALLPPGVRGTVLATEYRLTITVMFDYCGVVECSVLATEYRFTIAVMYDFGGAVQCTGYANAGSQYE